MGKQKPLTTKEIHAVQQLKEVYEKRMERQYYVLKEILSRNIINNPAAYRARVQLKITCYETIIEELETIIKQ